MRACLTPEQAVLVKKTLDDIEWDYVRKDMADMVQACLEGSVRVKDIVIGLRNFSRLDKGEVVELDANQALENTAKLLNSQIKNRIEIHWDLARDGRVRGNPSQLNQVFMNILANGLQAIDGRGDVWVRTWNEGEGNSGVFAISIRDSGKGIKKENLDRFSIPFLPPKKWVRGRGWPLHRLRYRGAPSRSIQVRSTVAPAEGHGTEFRAEIPQARADPQQLDDESAPKFHSLRILPGLTSRTKIFHMKIDSPPSHSSGFFGALTGSFACRFGGRVARSCARTAPESAPSASSGLHGLFAFGLEFGGDALLPTLYSSSGSTKTIRPGNWRC